MASKEFSLTPVTVEPVETKYRKICTQIPVPESVPMMKKLRDLEPRSMGGQPPVVWHSGSDCTVSDAYGNKWLDFSAGVLVTSVGHGRPEIVKAITDLANQGMYHSYCFPTEARIKLVEKITSMLPAPLARVFLVTTGSEATECCIKLARTKSLRAGKPNKKIIVTFENDFHGRTLGAQLAGGSPGLKDWAGESADFVQVPFPDGFRQADTSFDVFEKSLADQGINPDDVCGVMGETYQGCNATLFPAAYGQALRKWCDKHEAVLIFDEVQAGFGRTGKLFGFMHFGIVPDLVACGKGISGGMPLSAVLGTEELMSMYGPGEMTSTHSANPICSAAAMANIEVIEKENLVENAAKLEAVLLEGAKKIQAASGGKITHVAGTGLVVAMQFTKPGTCDPNPEFAHTMVEKAIQKGVMLFAPVGVGGCAIKINPPLTISEEALREGLGVLEEIAAEL
ncbi:MAG: aspartate aminotransferase family protein [Phycisphaerae bacterium]|nr:aspartate aminotransferase family protein [Phycisphaerae bacterium]